jgi:hypothetical protein
VKLAERSKSETRSPCKKNGDAAWIKANRIRSRAIPHNIAIAIRLPTN